MVNFIGINHHSILVADINTSIKFYQDILGLSLDTSRPEQLPFKGAWFIVGQQAIHLLELPNPDAANKRPEHGGRDRHVALDCEVLQPLIWQLKKQGVVFTQSKSGRTAIFFRDPDGNAIEVIERQN